MKIKKAITVLLILALIITAFPAGKTRADEAGQSGTESCITVKFGTPLVDGEKEDIWDIADSFKAEIGRNNPDSSVDCKFLWDDNALYIYAEIQDDTLDDASGNAYEQDSIEVFLDEINDRLGAYGDDDVHYRVNFNNLRTVDNGDLSRWYSATKLVNEGFVVEACIKWNKAIAIPANDSRYGFDLQLNCANGGSRVGERSIFAVTSDGYQDTSLFGEILLAGREAGQESGAFPYDLMSYIEEASLIDASLFVNGETLVEALAAARACLEGEYTTEDIEYQLNNLKAVVRALDDGSGFTSPLELTANPELPDLLTFFDGTTKVTAENWPERKAEIKAFYDYYMYGPMPDKSDEVITYSLGNMTVKDVTVADPVTGVKSSVNVKEGILTVNVARGDVSGSFNALLIVPTGEAPEGGYPFYQEMSMGQYGSDTAYYAASRGFACAIWSYTDIASDDASRGGLFYKIHPYGKSWQEQTGALVAWSWGASKLLDTLENGLADEFGINEKINMLSGVSRLGKATAVAGAYDERITYVDPTCSGAGGMACFRYLSEGKTYDGVNIGLNHNGVTTITVDQNEGLGSLQASGEAFWFNDNFTKLTSLEQLPFDQYFLAALMADPERYLMITAGFNGENWTNSAAMSLTYLKAREIYDLLGLRDHIFINVHETNEEGSTPNHKVIKMDLAYLIDAVYMNEYGMDPSDAVTDQKKVRSCVYFDDLNWDEAWNSLVGNNLTAVDYDKLAKAVTILDNGAALEDIAAALPSAGYVYVDEARYRRCSVNWNTEAVSYNPASTNESQFTVSGTMILPEDVTNELGLSLEVTTNVLVRSKPDDIFFASTGMTEENIGQANRYGIDNTVEGSGEARADLSIMCDGINIYVMADVTDADVYSNPNGSSEKEDGITLTLAQGIKAGRNVKNIVLTADGKASVPVWSANFDWNTWITSAVKSYNETEDIKVTSEATANGYRITAVIPYSAAGLKATGNDFAFEAILNDCSSNGIVVRKAAFNTVMPEHYATVGEGYFTASANIGLLASDLHAASLVSGIGYAVMIADGNTESEWNALPVFEAAKDIDNSESEEGNASLKLAWDDAYLYVLADVKDSDVYSAAADSDEEDSIVLSIAAPEGEVKNIVLTADGKLLTYSWTGDLDFMTFAGTAFKSFNTLNNSYIDAKVNDNGWKAEAAITWADLGITAVDGMEVMFDAIVNNYASETASLVGRKAIFADEYPVNNKTVSGNWFGFIYWTATYNAGFEANDLTKIMLTAKNTDKMAADIGRYSLLNYIASYEKEHVEPYPVKKSYDKSIIDAAFACAVDNEATAEDIIAARQSLEAMAEQILKDNCYGKLMVKKGTPLVDGVGDDSVWENAFTYKTGSDGKGQYADIKALWDDEAVYFLVNVYDPTFDVAGSDAHQKDSVEFFFIPEADALNNSFGRDGGQWRINRANITTVTFGDNEPFYAKLTEIEGGYTVEARYEFAKGMAIAENSVLNADIAVNLCENGARTSAVAWASGDCYNNPNTSGQMIFLGETAGDSSVEAGYNPYVLLKLLDKAIAMEVEDYDSASFNANYDAEKLNRYYSEAVSGQLSKEIIDRYYEDVIAMMSQITYDGEHKSVLGFKENADYPDAFTFENGDKVRTEEDWKLRHDEIQDLYEFYMYGKLPKAEETGLTKSFSYDAGSGNYTITLTRGEITSSFTFKAYIPAGTSREGGWPYIINFGGNISGAQDAGLAVIDYSANGDVASNDSYYNGVFYTMYPECRGDVYATGVGPLAARAWGAGLIIDCIESGIGELSKLNPELSAVTGFSYLGKNALVTGVLEDRIKVTNPEHSGIGGAAPFRYSAQGKYYTTEEYGFERDHLVTKIEPIGQVQGQGMAWVKTIFADFIGGDCTPFDTYMLLSLVAPRGLFVSGGYYDNGTNPEGMYAAYVQAKQVFNFLGCEDKIAFGDYPTDHASSDAENRDLFAFCNYVFYGDELPDGFYDTVFDNSPDKAEYDVIRYEEEHEDDPPVVVSGWQFIDGNWYYFTPETGEMVTHNKTIGGVYYLFNADGTLAGGVWKVNLKGTRYYVAGQYATGVTEIDGTKYCFGDDGYLCTNTTLIMDGVEYVVDADGVVGEAIIPVIPVTGFTTICGVTYYYKDDAVLTGWQYIDGNWYYFTPETGAMLTHNKTIGSVYYLFNADGTLAGGVWKTNVKGTRYYVAGQYATGIQTIDGVTYDFGSNGYLVGVVEDAEEPAEEIGEEAEAAEEAAEETAEEVAEEAAEETVEETAEETEEPVEKIGEEAEVAEETVEEIAE